jgi:sphinganine C4-monooxygenase
MLVSHEKKMYRYRILTTQVRKARNYIRFSQNDRASNAAGMFFMNQTSPPLNLSDWPHPATAFPLYYSHKEQVIDGVPDRITAVASPLIAYWTFSMFFHFLDVSGWKWLEKYKIHEPDEVKSKNLVSRSQVLAAVIIQQTVQTVLGLPWMQETERIFNHTERIHHICMLLQTFFAWYLGTWGRAVLLEISYLTYWWIIPAAQFIFAM